MSDLEEALKEAGRREKETPGITEAFRKLARFQKAVTKMGGDFEVELNRDKAGRIIQIELHVWFPRGKK